MMKVTYKYCLFLSVIFLFNPGKVYSFGDFDEDAFLKIISTIDSSIEVYKSERHCLEKIDSIAYSYKDVWDFSNEKSENNRNKNLGNMLTLSHHMIQYLLYVDYVEFNGNLLKIRYSLHYGNNNVSDSSKFIQFANSLSLDFKYGEQKFIFTKSYLKGLEKFQNTFPKVNLFVSSYSKTKNIEFVNDPINELTYGIACSVGGSPPKGLSTFASLVHYKEYSTLEKLLYSANPVARLYAADALTYAYKNGNYNIGEKFSIRINEIYSEDVEIETCSGCSFKRLPMKYAKIEFKEQMENPYENIIFTR